MGRSCFLLNCEANKLKRNPSVNALPTFFRFPKSLELLQKWKDVIPPRVGLKARDPTENDFLCSLHFRLDNVVKYFEYKLVKGLPRREVIQMERGIWSLKEDSVPCYFDNDNPNAMQLLKEVKHKTDSPINKPFNSNEPQLTSKDIVDINSEVCDASSSLTLAHEHLSQLDVSKSRSVNNSLNKSKFVMLDHCYFTKPNVEETFQLNSKPGRQNEDKPVSVTAPKLALLCEPYTIENLHQDILDVVIPKNWTFFQSDDDFNTVLMYSSVDGSVTKCVKFSGTCYPHITINSTVVNYSRINSKKQITELFELMEKVDGAKVRL